MLNRIFKDSLIYGITGILTRGIPLIMVPFYTRVLSPKDYGIIDLIAIFSALVNFIVAFEISQGLARHYADSESLSEKVSYASSALWFVIAAYGMFVCLGIQFPSLLSRFLLGDPSWSPVLQPAIAAMGANGIYFLLQDMLRWQLKPKSYSISSITYVVFTTGTAAYLILISKTGVIGIYFGQVVGAIIGSISAWYFSRDLYSFRFSWRKCKQMLYFSMPLVPSSIAVFLSFYIDRICIKYFMTLSDVGIYGIGFRFASIISLLVIGVRGSLIPMVYNTYKDPETPENISKIFRYFLICALPLYVFLSIYSREIVYFFTVPSFYAGWAVMPILGMSILLSDIYFFAPGMAIAKKTKIVALINIISVSLNALLNISLIPIMGIIGAALSTCVASFFSFAVRMRFSQKFYRVPHRWIRISTATMIATSAVAICLFFIEDSPTFSIQDNAIKFFIMILSVLFISLTLLWREDLELLTKKISWKLS